MTSTMFTAIMAIFGLVLWLLFAKLLVFIYNKIGDGEDKITVLGLTGPALVVGAVVMFTAWARIDCTSCSPVFRENWFPLSLSVSILIMYWKLKKIVLERFGEKN
jgi:hypothetical protein